MWQRIQTLWLLIATALCAWMLFAPIVTIPSEDGLEGIMLYDKTTYLIFVCVIIVGLLVALNTYKLLILQMRVTTLTLLVTLGFQIVLAIDFFRAPDGIAFRYTAIFPIICVILEALALRGIAVDQAMLESAHRLRDSKRKRK